MFFKSLRWQIQAWHGMVLVCVVGALLVAFYLFEAREKIGQLDDRLEHDLIMLMPALMPPNTGGAPPPPPPVGELPPPPPGMEGRPSGPARFAEKLKETPVYYVLWNADGSLRKSSENAPENLGVSPKSDQVGSSARRNNGDRREIVHHGPRGEILVVGIPMGAVTTELHHFGLELIGLGAVVIAVGLAGGWWLAGRAIRPIETISCAAREITGGDLSRRIDVSDTESELGQLAQVLNETFARLEQSFEQQVRFTADASHELRTPVAVILAQTQLALSKDRDSGEYRQALDICQRNARGMRSLVNELLELSKTDSARTGLSLADCDLAGIARDCVKSILPLAEENGISLSIETEPAPCKIDSDKIGRVIANLLSNAIRYNRPGGRVRIGVKRNEGAVAVEVTDNGMGIGEKDLPHIFERFYRADKSRTRTQGGSGLGLAICRAYVTAHGGDIRVESVSGKGSTFTVEIPVLS